ncbi:unnamed protein product [Tuber melanosporum]|uniref:(Perigord truffle) hypothetical protein n=1 Tax=Tuber melanosporum (strain Mel28) TaxID=656061 RepID=D5GEB3_TUBMM|nr:uncharacterized protein GSTUM_00001252001 [Tuber melanosporum]CAZ82856.1 unnamed protein product [Tuber melanosporum]
MSVPEHLHRKSRRRDRIFNIIGGKGGYRKPDDTTRPHYAETLRQSMSQASSITGSISVPGLWSAKFGFPVPEETPDLKLVTIRKNSLWDTAYRALPQEEREAFPESSGHRNSALEDARADAETYRSVCYERRSKFNWKAKDLLLHDVVSRIITWIDKFKTIGDIVSQYDPAHAVLPWVGFRFLLQVGSKPKVSIRSISWLPSQLIYPSLSSRPL